MKRQTVSLLPFAPHQRPNAPPPPWSPQHSVTNSRLPSLVNTSVPCIMSSTSRKQQQLFILSRRPNPLRIRPSIISEASCDTTTSCSSESSSSSSSSSFPNTSSPTSLSTPPTSSPPSPSPPPPYVLITPSWHFRQSDCRACGCDALIAIASHARFSLFSSSHHLPGKSRPLPQPPAPTERPLIPYDVNDTDPSQPRSRTPPPAWSPPGTPSPSSRPTRPALVLPLATPQRESPTSPEIRMTPSSPSTHRTVPDGSISSPGQLRVRPLPMRPVPPGPPSEANTPIAPYGVPRWEADTLTTPPDDILSPFDDRRAIDWDLIDEVMTHSS